MAPHGKTGPAIAPARFTIHSGYLQKRATTETPQSIGGVGGYVGLLDSSFRWKPMRQMKQRFASSYVLYFGNW